MAENWDEAAPAVELPEIKLFGKWSSDDVQVNDISLTVSSWVLCRMVWMTYICNTVAFLSRSV